MVLVDHDSHPVERHEKSEGQPIAKNETIVEREVQLGDGTIRLVVCWKKGQEGQVQGKQKFEPMISKRYMGMSWTVGKMRDADRVWPSSGGGQGGLAWRRERDLVAQGRVVRERVARSWPRIHA